MATPSRGLWLEYYSVELGEMLPVGTRSWKFQGAMKQTHEPIVPVEFFGIAPIPCRANSSRLGINELRTCGSTGTFRSRTIPIPPSLVAVTNHAHEHAVGERVHRR